MCCYLILTHKTCMLHQINLTVISSLESRYNSVSRNNERNKIIMFILRLLVNQCSVHVKQKSKAKHMAKKAHIIQCPFYLYSASTAEGGPSFDSYLLLGGTGQCPIQFLYYSSNLLALSSFVYAYETSQECLARSK